MHAAAHHGLGLADLLTALPDCAGSDLLQRNGGAFVCLGMRAQPHAGGTGETCQLVNVVFEGIEIDDQCRRVDLVDRAANLRGDYVHSTSCQWGYC